VNRAAADGCVPLILHIEDAIAQIGADGGVDARIDQMLVGVGEGRNHMAAGQLDHRSHPGGPALAEGPIDHVHGARDEAGAVEPASSPILDSGRRRRRGGQSGGGCKRQQRKERQEVQMQSPISPRRIRQGSR
jgi:hypothetical protein